MRFDPWPCTRISSTENGIFLSPVEPGGVTWSIARAVTFPTVANGKHLQHGLRSRANCTTTERKPRYMACGKNGYDTQQSTVPIGDVGVTA